MTVTDQLAKALTDLYQHVPYNGNHDQQPIEDVRRRARDALAIYNTARHHSQAVADDLAQTAGGHLAHDEIARRVRFDLMARDRIVWLARRLAALEEACSKLRPRMSAALEDPGACAEYKADIEHFLEVLQ